MGKNIIAAVTITEEQFYAILEKVSVQDAKIIAGMMRKKIDEDLKENTPIQYVDLSKRVLKILQEAKIKSVGDLLQYEEDDVAKFRNMGKVGLKEIREKVLEIYGKPKK